MAAPLKDHFGADVPPTLAEMIAAVHPAFPSAAFIRDALDGYEALELTARGRHVAEALHRHLPADFPAAVGILVRSLQQPVRRVVGAGMGGFLFMPHCYFVAAHGLGHFEESMAAQHALTQRFTCEFSIRPFLTQHQAATLERLRTWARDPSEHVRRLVSEGTRPRLPWAMRLPAFQADPGPVLALLELLRDDPSLYVRRSVANNLNDIGKDHPGLLCEVAARWLSGASPERAWIVRRALRWAVKQGDPGALAVLGYGEEAVLEPAQIEVSPAQARKGGEVSIRFEIHNATSQPQRLMVDLCVHYVKANGATRPKVFKLSALTLEAGEKAAFQKRLSLREMTTRRHFAGRHRVDAILNGQAMPLGSFELLDA
jgi:3-methyladenine DNA glycosylase AlkC